MLNINILWFGKYVESENELSEFNRIEFSLFYQCNSGVLFDF